MSKTGHNDEEFEQPLEPILQQVVASLKAPGYLHLDQPISKDDFLELANRLGSISRRETISLYQSQRGAHQPRALGFHTDHCDADLIAWQCDIPEPTGGPTLLLEAMAVFDAMNDRQKEALTRVEMFSPDPDSYAQKRVPCLTLGGDEPRFYFTPWNLCPIHDPEIQSVWNWFIEQVETADSFEIDLKKDECLFINNKRFFHGRGVLPKDSKRSLDRVWISHTPAS